MPACHVGPWGRGRPVHARAPAPDGRGRPVADAVAGGNLRWSAGSPSSEGIPTPPASTTARPMAPISLMRPIPAMPDRRRLRPGEAAAAAVFGARRAPRPPISPCRWVRPRILTRSAGGRPPRPRPSVTRPARRLRHRGLGPQPAGHLLRRQRDGDAPALATCLRRALPVGRGKPQRARGSYRRTGWRSPGPPKPTRFGAATATDMADFGDRWREGGPLRMGYGGRRPASCPGSASRS